jgi:hypothetical protein
MTLSAHDKLSVCFSDALIKGYSEFYWPSFVDKRFTVVLEINGGLPILTITDSNSLLSVHDITAFACLRMLEAIE